MRRTRRTAPGPGARASAGRWRCWRALDWPAVAADSEAKLKAAGYRRIEGSEGPDGELARFINDDETRLAVLIRRTPLEPWEEWGLKDYLLLMACELEKRPERDVSD